MSIIDISTIYDMMIARRAELSSGSKKGAPLLVDASKEVSKTHQFNG
ncbi:MAG: hypothetical protein ACLVAA_01995 [Ruthenibacterium sp.]